VLTNPVDHSRLLSLDFLRGLIMILLVLESTGLYWHLIESSEGSLHSFFLQFEHHPWNGLRFWDLVQPAFMFMAGTALAYSLNKQQLEGKSWGQQFWKTLKRCGWLFFWGVLDYAVRDNGLSFELWDVLTQLSFTTLVAFLIYRWSPGAQIGFSIGLLILTEILYRFTNIPGFDQAFVDQHNFGNYIDLLLMNKINGGGWVAINCIPTACHTIWGALAGRLLLSNRTRPEKMNTLVIAGVVGLVAGYVLDITSVTPIIKRISTSSFVLASAGWVFFALAISYWWIDIKNHRNNLKFFLVVGMNSLFIYLFIEIVAARWFNGYVGALTLNTPFVTSLVLFGLEWGMCYWLYRQKIFFKI
jgi:predicted acyltransferase